MNHIRVTVYTFFFIIQMFDMCDKNLFFTMSRFLLGLYFVGDNCQLCPMSLFQLLPDSALVRQSNFVVGSLQNLCSRSHQYMYQYGIYLTVKKSIENK